MKARKEGVAVWRLDENRYAISVDQVTRYVGSQDECQRRAEILLPKNTRDRQDHALARACQMGGSVSVWGNGMADEEAAILAGLQALAAEDGFTWELNFGASAAPRAKRRHQIF
jgi:hypothetical protein